MNWFTGVVEDRDDPQELGRVRVRIFGLHTDDIAKIRTADLPWAHVIMPPTSASISGVGQSPTGLVEGSWVVGFFADGDNCQDPMIFGSVHGYPSQRVTDMKAFKDFEGNYPRWYDETDVSKIARSSWASHSAYETRKGMVVTDIETATPPKLDTTTTGQGDFERKTWSEPEPRDGVTSLYPYVHVWESETGIVREHDDSPGGSRIHEYHPGGTFYEIYPDGRKVTKVAGDNYEIIVHDDNVLIRGAQNVTIEGTAKHLVKGDYIMEVSGDYNLKVHGNRNTKITGNDSQEVIGNSNYNIALDSLIRTGGNQTILTDGNKTESIGGTSGLTVTGATDYMHMSTLSIFSVGDQTVSTNANQTIQSTGTMSLNSNAAWTLKCNADSTLTVSGKTTTTSGGNFKVTAPRIDLN